MGELAVFVQMSSYFLIYTFFGYLDAFQFEIARYLFRRPSFLSKQLHGSSQNTSFEGCVSYDTLTSYHCYLIGQSWTVTAPLVAITFQLTAYGRSRYLCYRRFFSFQCRLFFAKAV